MMSGFFFTMYETFIIVILCCGLKIAASVEAEESGTYRAAVVEYYSVRDGDSPEYIFNKNANNYEKFIETASKYNADIIVFPESGLTDGRDSTDRELYPNWSSFIPDPELNVNPCIDETETLEAVKIISCAARNHSIYVTINLSEKSLCPKLNNNCSDDGFLFYNTNVVFDRNGSIIARYRKYNLFGEVGFNTTEYPDLTTFETDFGVTFGVFIAFDIIFREPSLTLIRDLNITDFIYNLHWFSALPFMTAVQTEMAWSYTMDVNLLASGYNRPDSGCGGSGIFGGRRGTIVSEFPETASNILLIADVPKRNVINSSEIDDDLFALVYDLSDLIIPNAQNSTGEISLRRDNLEPYTTFEINPSNQDEYNLELCDRGLCCHFYSKTNWLSNTEDTKSTFNTPSSASVYYRYRFAVFNGVRDYSGIRTGGIQTCAIFSCTGNDIASCGLRLSQQIPRDYVTRFSNLTITGDFPNDLDKLQIVETLTDARLLPLQADEIFLEFDERNENRSIKFQLVEPQDDLLTFAIYGRDFTADGSKVTVAENNSGQRQIIEIFLIFLNFIILLDM